jgi:hypothetical protein
MFDLECKRVDKDYIIILYGVRDGVKYYTIDHLYFLESFHFS